jgi:dipeptidyl aminopeptidase/acylaminoacyl peptidase
VVRWKSFDGREISGLYYHPPARFTGKRPVFIVFHGARGSQARPGFIGRYNYLLNDLGIALIYPSARGSSGFGKAFAALDDGKRREDSVRDVGSLIEWIRVRADLDGARVLAGGDGYGGYMALASAARSSGRVAGAIGVMGRGDPQVPFAQAEQIAAALKKRGVPVWLIAASDEDHDLQKPKADYLFYAAAEFARRVLLQ